MSDSIVDLNYGALRDVNHDAPRENGQIDVWSTDAEEYVPVPNLRIDPTTGILSPNGPIYTGNDTSAFPIGITPHLGSWMRFFGRSFGDSEQAGGIDTYLNSNSEVNGGVGHWRVFDAYNGGCAKVFEVDTDGDVGVTGDINMANGSEMLWNTGEGTSGVKRGSFGDFLGVSLQCVVGYELNWQGGVLTNYTPGPGAVPLRLGSDLQMDGNAINMVQGSIENVNALTFSDPCMGLNVLTLNGGNIGSVWNLNFLDQTDTEQPEGQLSYSEGLLRVGSVDSTALRLGVDSGANRLRLPLNGQNYAVINLDDDDGGQLFAFYVDAGAGIANLEGGPATSQLNFNFGTDGPPLTVLSAFADGHVAFASGATVVDNAGRVGIGAGDQSGSLSDFDIALLVRGQVNINDADGKSVRMGVDSGTPYIEGDWTGLSPLPLSICPNGGHALIGTEVDDGFNALQVNGSVLATDFLASNTVQSAGSIQARGITDSQFAEYPGIELGFNSGNNTGFVAVYDQPNNLYYSLLMIASDFGVAFPDGSSPFVIDNTGNSFFTGDIITGSGGTSTIELQTSFGTPGIVLDNSGGSDVRSAVFFSSMSTLQHGIGTDYNNDGTNDLFIYNYVRGGADLLIGADGSFQFTGAISASNGNFQTEPNGSGIAHAPGFQIFTDPDTFVGGLGGDNTAMYLSAYASAALDFYVAGNPTPAMALHSDNSVTTAGTTLDDGAGNNISVSYTGSGAGLTDLPAQVYAGSFSGTGTATTSFVVTIGVTMANTAYKIGGITPTNTLSSAAFNVSNKTTTSFTVTYLAGLTGAVAFDWSIVP